jgi:hypothetical protein
VHANGSDDLEYLGFRVAGPDEFQQMQKQLSAAGLKYRVASEEEAEERRVLEVLKLEDPAGNPVEIFSWPGGSVQQTLPSGAPNARALQDRHRRRRPLHRAPGRCSRGASILHRVWSKYWFKMVVYSW